LVEEAVDAPVAADGLEGEAGALGVEVVVDGVVIPDADFVIAEEAGVAGLAVEAVAGLEHAEERAVHGPVEAVMVVGAARGIAVIEAGHDVGGFGGFEFDEGAPGGVGVGGHPRGVEEDADGVAAETVLHEEVVILGDEEVVAGGDAATRNWRVLLRSFCW